MKGYSRIDGRCIGRTRAHVEGAEVLDAIVFAHIGRLTRRQPHEILSAVRDDYGNVGLRRFWRSLARLRSAGKVQRHGRHNQATYTRKARA